MACAFRIGEALLGSGHPAADQMVGWLMKQPPIEVASQVWGEAFLSVFFGGGFTCGWMQRLKILEKPTRMSWVAYRSYGPEVFETFQHGCKDPSTLKGLEKPKPASQNHFYPVLNVFRKEARKKDATSTSRDLKSWRSAGLK